ncbi:MAG: Isoquinoline 1-oxidoreductase subunit [Pseudomonadota bacterium]
MSKLMGRAALIVAGAAAMLAACSQETSTPAATGPTEVNGLKTPAAFAGLEGEARAAALFQEMAKVMLHPRCANCHPRQGGPTQGDDFSAHVPPVIRGDGVGAAAMECSTCHGTENVEFASMEGSVPGAEPWLLAPASMGWRGASAGELCAQVKDPELNGGRSMEDLVEHNSVDHLVNWAWHPGAGRSPAPGDQETFGALTEAWVEAGGACPTTEES